MILGADDSSFIEPIKVMCKQNKTLLLGKCANVKNCIMTKKEYFYVEISKRGFKRVCKESKL
ncbi:hypothetical protein DSECCO2_620080 [anaerobic digester metagenome]